MDDRELRFKALDSFSDMERDVYDTLRMIAEAHSRSAMRRWHEERQLAIARIIASSEEERARQLHYHLRAALDFQTMAHRLAEDMIAERMNRLAELERNPDA